MPPSTILVFGEDSNDTQAICVLVKAIAPPAKQIPVKAIRRPIILSRNAEARKRKAMCDEIAGFSKGYEGAGKAVAIIAHRDCDSTEPAHVQNSTELESALRSAGVKIAVAATPAWEIETCWMLFPKAINKVRGCWQSIDYKKQNVGLFANAKERLIKDLRPKSGSHTCPDFRESDGIKVSGALLNDPDILNKIEAKSDSFEEFRKKIIALFPK